ncbi:hypothetical protein THASP1DRAFT_33835 [Thamnocephalis sphaerospora]|uniref:PLD phosphodiesterase domain-containing protein n=1 Tax=Thamnocephalis sphaerospora TaxID=78915 RepID=A0A4P9XFN0_9FUNG|nr:hypothetical protein THASP1DRAFT_33835 [Thamnocephalis sphaerospora]|eukprot:RKP04403.1 hypothetical protein THASP1DRAFT_33835 [Thamnocephalis sphaerospora]
MFSDLIRKADEEVVALTYLFDRLSSCTRDIAQAVRDLNGRAQKDGRRVRVFFMVDSAGLMLLESTQNMWRAEAYDSKVSAASVYPLGLLSSLSYGDGVHSISPEIIGLPAAHEVPALDLRVRTFHYWTVGTLHSKTLTVDGYRTVVGSKNMDAEIGSELLVELEGPVARSIRTEFYHIWRSGRFADDGDDEYGMAVLHTSPNGTTAANDTKLVPAMPDGMQVKMPPLQRHSNPRATADMVPILVLSRRWSPSMSTVDLDSAQNAAWLAAFQLAKQKIYIQTPNFNAVPAREALVESVKRGVRVDLVTSYRFEEIGETIYPSSQADGNNHEAYRRLYQEVGQDIKHPGNGTFRGCWYIGHRQPANAAPSKDEWTHIKLMNVDDELVIFGSGNMDAQSWFHSHETNLLVDDAAFAKEITKELIDQQRSFSPCHAV